MKAGGYKAPKGAPDKNPAATKKYIDGLSDERLVAAGRYACTVSKDKVSKAQFQQILLKNPGTEKAFKPVIGLLWDQAQASLCQ